MELYLDRRLSRAPVDHQDVGQFDPAGGSIFVNAMQSASLCALPKRDLEPAHDLADLEVVKVSNLFELNRVGLALGGPLTRHAVGPQRQGEGTVLHLHGRPGSGELRGAVQPLLVGGLTEAHLTLLVPPSVEKDGCILRVVIVRSEESDPSTEVRPLFEGLQRQVNGVLANGSQVVRHDIPTRVDLRVDGKQQAEQQVNQ